jgi:hypothetical protein
MKVFILGGLALIALAQTPAYTKPADQLSCLTEHLSESDYVAFGEMVTVEEETKRTQKEPDFVALGMKMSICANRLGWTENERNNSVAYAVAYPMSKGMRLLGEKAGYAAIDRLFAANPDAVKGDSGFDRKALDPLIDQAVADGLKLDGSESARNAAALYLNSLYAIAHFRRNFEAGRFSMPKHPE